MENTTLENELTEPLDEYIFDRPSVRICLYVAYTAVFCLCFFGNLTVVIVVTLHWRMRSITKFCMGNLAFANLCVAIFCIYQNLSTFLEENWKFGHFLCKMYYFTSGLSHTASILILVVVCVERYLSIVHPLRFRRMLTIQRLRMIIVFVWFLSALVSAPRLYFISTFEVPIQLFSPSETEVEVICAPIRSLYDARTADMCNFVLLFLAPLLVISVLYAKIGKIIWRSSAVFKPAAMDRCSLEISSSLLVKSHVEIEEIPRVPPNSFVSEISSIESHRNGDNAENALLRVVCGNPSHGSTRATFKNLASSLPSVLKDSSSNSVQSGVRHNGANSSVHVTNKNQDFKYNAKFAEDVDRKLQTVMQKRAADERLTQENRQRIPAPAVLFIRNRRHGTLVRTRQAAIRMLIVIVITFALCNFPYHLRKMCQYYVPNYNIHGSFNQFMTPITFLLMYTNCALNPILYAFMSKHFRSSFMDLLKLRLKRPNPARGLGRLNYF